MTTLVLALAILAVPSAQAAKQPAGHRVDGKLGEWRGTPAMLAGHARLSRGELIYTDYLYDDYGADLDGGPNRPVFRGVLSPTDGDLRYPTDEGRYGNNAADLRELRIAADRKRLHLLVALQTMLSADAAVAMLAIDTDGDPKTGAAAWPHGAGVETPGADRFVTLWGSGGDVLDPASKPLGHPRQAVNLADNAIEASVDLGLLGPLASRPRVWLVTGLADPGSGDFKAPRVGDPTAELPGGGGPGASAVFNVAFREREAFEKLRSFWSERSQSRALADRDVAEFAHTIDLPALRAGRSEPFDPLRSGYHNAIHDSRPAYGEGIDLKHDSTGGTAAPMFKSRYQPYGVYVPKGYKRGGPLTLVGHSLDLSHNQYAGNTPGLRRQLGDERGSVLITPLARGTDTWYLEAGLADTMEAWADARRRYRSDRDRTAITGYSMGGYMTYRMGLLMPDRFSRASVYVGPPAYQVWPYPGSIVAEDPAWLEPGNTNKIVENALNLPFEIVHGNLDELVPVAGVRHQADTFNRLGRVHRFYHHSADDHFSFYLGDQWARTRDWFGDHRRDPNPARVVYKRYPNMDLPKLGLVFDGAYWVDGMTVRGTSDAKTPNGFGMVDAASFALGKAPPLGQAESFAVPGPTSPATVSGLRHAAVTPTSRRNAFEATLTNLSAVTFKLSRMGIDPRKTIEATLRGDGPVTVTLLYGKRSKSQRLTLDLKPGETRKLSIRPRRDLRRR